jgi:serine/threonine-protein kinase
MCQYLSGDQKIKCLEKILEMDPDFEPAQIYLANEYFAIGNYDKALALYEKLDRQYSIANIYMKTGKISEARQVLNKLLENPIQYPPQSRAIARLCFFVGKKNEGFEWLEKACEEKDGALLGLKSDPDFESVRGDPRFQAILKKLGLEK